MSKLSEAYATIAELSSAHTYEHNVRFCIQIRNSVFRQKDCSLKEFCKFMDYYVRAPWTITASCGIDALSHGLEGAIADVRSSQDDMGKSRQCVRLVLENLPKLKEHPEDIAARGAMCLMPVLRSQMDSCAQQLSELARFCNFNDVDALFNALESVIALCELNIDGSIVNPDDFKELSEINKHK